jgi:hypothetical protein
VILAPYFVQYATGEQKRRWLPRMVRGDLVAALAMSEPGAGSDVQPSGGFFLWWHACGVTFGRGDQVATLVASTDAPSRAFEIYVSSGWINAASGLPG